MSTSSIKLSKTILPTEEGIKMSKEIIDMKETMILIKREDIDRKVIVEVEVTIRSIGIEINQSKGKEGIDQDQNKSKNTNTAENMNFKVHLLQENSKNKDKKVSKATQVELFPQVLQVTESDVIFVLI